ncbi:MAG: allantoinase AllB [Bacteroidetes bacterium]|nr:allantoinase AllB [Bacteroidota bacterium]MBS1648702.1 allantoinase AllB [Bacteroidota bacterium]
MQERKIYSNKVWVNNKLQPATICFAKGKINAIHFEKLMNVEDFSSNIIIPGVIDVHVHINEPGRTDWEGFETATQAAAAGGSTTIIDMPLNSSPVTTTVDAFNEKLNASKNKLNVNVGFYGGLIPGNAQHIEPLIKAGVVGIKCFLTHSGINEFPNVTKKDLDEAMPILAKYNIPLLAHCELSDKEKHSLLNEHPTSYQEYLKSRPKQWENDAVDLMITKCRQHKCPVHIVHVSSSECIDKIYNAKKEGLPITAETCTQYLYFNAEQIPDAKTIYKCAPPIREKENNIQLKQALKNGVLDFITTDHSPAPANMKEIDTGNLQKAWGGIAGIQFLLNASWSALKNIMTIEEFIPFITSKPAQFIKAKHKGEIKVGYDADIVVWNNEEQHTVLENEILFKHKISPYIGETLTGSVIETIINGQTVYQTKQINKKNIGQWLKPQ